MNVLDWLIAGILVLSVIHAAAQGFVFELFSLAGTVFGYLLAAWEYPVAARYIAPYVKSDVVAAGAGFLLIFIAVVILAGIAGRIVRWATTSVGLRGIDRLLGGTIRVVTRRSGSDGAGDGDGEFSAIITGAGEVQIGTVFFGCRAGGCLCRTGGTETKISRRTEGTGSSSRQYQPDSPPRQ